MLVAVLCARYRMHSLSYDIVRCTAWRSISRYRVIDIGPSDKGAAKIFEALTKVQVRVEAVEVKLETVNEKVEQMGLRMQELEEKLDHTEIVEEIKESINDEIENVTTKMTAVTHTLDEVRSRVLEERDREQRASNIIMYNIAEPAAASREDKWRSDRQFCMDLFNKVLGVSIVENDMKRFLRLGKSRDSSESPRPVLVQFRDRVLKNMIMESLSKLKDAELKYKQVI